VNWNDHAWAAGLYVSGAPPASAVKGGAAKIDLGAELQLGDIGKVWRRSTAQWQKMPFLQFAVRLPDVCFVRLIGEC
jgi:hypothetical protein